MFRYERDDGDEDEDQYSSFGYERDLDPGSSSDEDDINSIQDQLLSHVHYTSSWMGASQSLPATVPKALMGKQDRSEPSDNGQSDDDNDNDNNNDSDNNSDDDDHDDNDDNDDNDDDKDKITNKNGDRDGVGSRSGNDIDRPKVRATPEDATLVGSIGSDPLSSPRPTIPPGSSAAASPITFQKQAIKPPVLQSSLKPQNDSLEVTHVIQPELFSAQLETKLADPKGITLAELLESRPTTVSNFTGLSHQIQCKFCREYGHVAYQCKAKELECQFCKEDHDPTKCPLEDLCFNCFGLGHQRKDCPMSESKRFCYECDRPSHMTVDCPYVWRHYDRRGARPTNSVVSVICYNCGSTDHWGDDCGESYRRRTSAFNALALRQLNPARDRPSVHPSGGRLPGSRSSSPRPLRSSPPRSYQEEPGRQDYYRDDRRPRRGRSRSPHRDRGRDLPSAGNQRYHGHDSNYRQDRWNAPTMQQTMNPNWAALQKQLQPARAATSYPSSSRAQGSPAYGPRYHGSYGDANYSSRRSGR